MTDYKRMVSYMYQYENGVKRKNVGFARVEAKGGQCKLTLHMQLLGQLDSIFPIYLIHRGDNMELIYLGDAILKNQIMDSKLTADETNIMGSGYALSEMGGVLLFLNDNVYFATEWDDKPIAAGEVLEALRPKNKKKAAMNEEAKAGMFQGTGAALEEETHEDNNGVFQAADLDAVSGRPERTLEEELRTPRYQLPGGWKMIERLQYAKAAAEAAADQSKKENEEDSSAKPALPNTDHLGKDILVRNVPETEKPFEAFNPFKDLGNLYWSDRYQPADNQYQQSGNMEYQGEMQSDHQKQGYPDLEQFTKVSQEHQYDSQYPEQDNTYLGMNQEEQGILEEQNMQMGQSIPTDQNMQAEQNIQLEQGMQEEQYMQQGQSIQTGQSMQEEQNMQMEQSIPIEQAMSEGFAPEDDNRAGFNPSCSYENYNQPDHPTARHFFDHYPRIYPFEDNEIILCVKIEPKDISLLPQELWQFGNNSFLMHGFYCYHHLIFAKMKNRMGCRYIIGIPGIYHSREQFMARMFGFECFKSIRKRELKQGDFGYWYLPVYFK